MTKLSDLKPGDTVVIDGGFTCMKPGDYAVHGDSEDQLFVRCSHGRHYLIGQADDEDNLIGIK